jgi:hypothetical protein
VFDKRKKINVAHIAGLYKLTPTTPAPKPMTSRPVWHVKTAFGEALRGESELLSETDPDGCIHPVPSLVVPECVRPTDFHRVLLNIDDLPPEKNATAVRNICGFVSGYAAMANHPAWRQRRSTLGTFNEAYTMRSGNVIFLRGKAIFKGGTSYAGVLRTMEKLLEEPKNVVLKTYLIVATAYLDRNVCVNPGCLIEQMLAERFPWCRVMRRHEELSNAIIFYINDFKTLDVAKENAPDLGTISVSRRGVINARFTWHDGVEWTGNDLWIRLTDSVKDFLLRIC